MWVENYYFVKIFNIGYWYVEDMGERVSVVVFNINYFGDWEVWQVYIVKVRSDQYVVYLNVSIGWYVVQFKLVVVKFEDNGMLVVVNNLDWNCLVFVGDQGDFG